MLDMDINAMQLQKMLETEDVVSLAWLQRQLELGYGEARQLAELLIKRGWLGAETPSGYKVEKQNLFLREVKKCEVGKFVDAFTSDCGQAVGALVEHQEEGLPFKPIEKEVRGESDTREALETLLRLRLIFQKDDLYFLRVSQKTVEVFKEMMVQKRLMERKEIMDRRKLMACFDVLFA